MNEYYYEDKLYGLEKQMAQLQTNMDVECAHIRADEILIETIETLSEAIRVEDEKLENLPIIAKDIVNKFYDVQRWYA